MNTLLIDNDTKHIDSFKSFLSPVDIIQKNALHLHNLDSYNAIILSGSQSHSVIKHAELYRDEVQLIKESKTPILGICLGFELMVYAFGGKLKKMPNKIQEIHRIDYTNDPIFEGVSDLVVYKGHRWIVETLPQEFISLAHSATGIEVIKHKERFLYGVQFHPEAYPESTNGYKILQNFLKMVKVKMQR